MPIEPQYYGTAYRLTGQMAGGKGPSPFGALGEQTAGTTKVAMKPTLHAERHVGHPHRESRAKRLAKRAAETQRAQS